MLTEDLLDKAASGFVVVSIYVGILGSIAVLSWQTYYWLRTGTWHQVPLSAALEYFGVSLVSIYYPDDWRGAARFAQWLLEGPISIYFPICCIALSAGIKVLISYDSV